MTLQTDLEAAVAEAQAAADKLKAIVNGPASGAGSTVEVDSGTVKTLARALAEVGDTSLQALKDLTNVASADFAAAALAAGVGGSGDMVGANNLAEITDPEVALANLGAQAQDVLLDALAAISPTAGDLLYINGEGDLANLAKGGDGNVLSLASGLPGWTAPPAAGASLTAMRVYTASDTWNKPTGLVRAEVLVVGGGGGGGSGNGSDRGGTGGGAGGWSRKLIEAASLGTTETVTVGSGGAGGNPGSAGGTSSFGSHCSATGGGGGVQGNNSTQRWGGAAGTGSGGDANGTGGTGFGRPGYTNDGGGDLYHTCGTPGGGSILGWGGEGGHYGDTVSPVAGTNGSGGGGGYLGGTGAAGGSGIIMVWEYTA